MKNMKGAMKRTIIGIWVVGLPALWTLASCVSGSAPASGVAPAPTASANYTGDGGKGMSLAILAPKASGLTANEDYLPSLVQGEFVSNFSDYSAISVLDRVALDKVYAELLGSGHYDDNDAAGLDLGHLTATDYLMTGNITKTTTGYALQIQITNTADKTTAAPYSGTCTVAELDDLTGIRRASRDLLEKLGVSLTEKAKTELAGAAAASHVNAQTTLAQGITAQQQGTEVRAMSYYFQAASYDSSLTEAASRVNILAADITSGNMGADIRNDIAWRDQWRARLAEAEQSYADYMKRQPLYSLVYDVNLKSGETNYSNNTVPISGVTIDLLPDVAWFNAAVGVVRMVNVVRDGLLATGQAEKWGLNWPRSTVGTSPFDGRNQHFEVGAELVNADGKTIGSERITMSSGYDVKWNDRSIWGLTPRLNGIQNLTFSQVNAYDITDKLTVRIATIDGTRAETATQAKGVNILREAEYARLPDVVAGLDSRAIARFMQNIELSPAGEITGYKGGGGRLVIPASFFGLPVTAIGEEAFTERAGKDANGNEQYKGKGLTSVVIPNSVTRIGARAFRGNLLTSVVIPTSVTRIDYQAFFGSYGNQFLGSYSDISYNQITSIVIGNNVSIGTLAFAASSSDYKHLFSIQSIDQISYFEDFYEKNGKKAGTYTRPDAKSKKWTWQP